MALKTATSTTPIGLHFCERALHAVQFGHNGRGNRLTASITGLLPPIEERTPEALADALRELSDSAPWIGRHVVAALPAEEVDIRPIRLADDVKPGNDARFRAALVAQSRAVLIYDPREAVLDFLHLPWNREEPHAPAHVLLVATRKKRVNDYLSALNAARLRCLCLDIVPRAVVRALARSNECLLFVDIQPGHTLVSISQEGDLLFSRVIRRGIENIVTALSRETDLQHDAAYRTLQQVGIDHSGQFASDLNAPESVEALSERTVAAMIFEATLREWDQLAHEIQRSVEYFSLQPYGAPIQGVRVVGDIVPPGFDAFLSGRLGVPVEPGRLVGAYAKAMEGYGKEQTAAIGLAMRGGRHAV